MNWRLDTDTIVYYMRAMPAVVGQLEATRVSSRYVSLITLGELYFRDFPLCAGREKFAEVPPILCRGETPAFHSRDCRAVRRDESRSGKAR